MDEKGKSSNERSEEKEQEEVSENGSTRREPAVEDSNAAGPSASVPEIRARFDSSLSLVDHHREPLHCPARTDGISGEPADSDSEGESQDGELVSQNVIDDVCRMYLSLIVRETYRINSMSQAPRSASAFAALKRLGFPSSFERAFKARYGAVADGRPSTLRDDRLTGAAAQVPDYIKNILDEYGLSGILDNEKPDVGHVDDHFVGESSGRSGLGCGDPERSRLRHRGNVRRPSAPSDAENNTDTQESDSEAKEKGEVE